MNLQYTAKLIKLAKEIDYLIRNQDYEGVKFRISYLVGYILSLEEIAISEKVATGKDLNIELKDFGIHRRLVNALKKFRVYGKEYENGFLYKPIYTLYELLNEVQNNGWERIEDTRGVGVKGMAELKKLVLSEKPTTSDNIKETK